MEELFKKKGKGPMKFPGFDFIGQHPDYQDIFYYVQELPLHNYDFIEAKFKVLGKKKPNLTAGTSIKTIDTFMYYYLLNKSNKKAYNEDTFVKNVVKQLEKDYGKDEMQFIRDTYSNKIPKDIKNLSDIKKAKREGYNVLYVCDTALIGKKFSQVTIVLVKDVKVQGFKIDREYTSFRTLLYMTKPSYVKGEATAKYNVQGFPDLNICLDLFK